MSDLLRVQNSQEGFSLDVGILGGGLAGLLLAYELKKLGIRATVIEKEPTVGGLCRSLNVNGYTFDYGSHILFSKDKALLEYLLKFLNGNYISHYRNTKILYKGKLVKYPFENGLHDLDINERYECVIDFINAYIARNYEKKTPPQNFKEWCYYVFGKSISEKYLIPYNEKIWKRPLEEISLEWVGGRVPNPPFEDILKSALGIPTEGYTHQLNFYYPLRGGIQALVEGIASKLDRSQILTEFEVKTLKIEDQKFYISNGKKELEFDKVISSIPLLELIKAIKNVPKDIVNISRRLQYNSLVVIMLGLPKSAILVKNVHWLYVPHEGIFHRISFLHNYSQHMAPKNKGSILAEVSIPNGKKPNLKEILEITKEDLEKLCIIKNKEDTEIEHAEYVKYAYIVYDHAYTISRETIIKYLKSIGIDVLGRFGSWKYLNMDAVALDVLSYVKNLGDIY